MAAIKSLTQRCLVLEGGRLVFDGPTDHAIRRYTEATSRLRAGSPTGRGSHTRILGAQLIDDDGKPTGRYSPGTPLIVEVDVETDGAPRLSLEVIIVDAHRQKLALGSLHQFQGITLPGMPGSYRVRMPLSAVWLASGSYSVDVTTSVVNSNWDHYVEDALRFDVDYCNPDGYAWDYKLSYGLGAIALPCIQPPHVARVMTS